MTKLTPAERREMLADWFANNPTTTLHTRRKWYGNVNLNTGALDCDDLAAMLEVSRSTVREDLHRLVGAGVLSRTTERNGTAYHYSFRLLQPDEMAVN